MVASWLRGGMWLLVAAALFCTSSRADPKSVRASSSESLFSGKWSAYGNTSLSITGDVEVSTDQLLMNHRSYGLTFVREIDRPSELKEAWKSVGAEHPTIARLYKVKIPATVRLLNGNNICGPDDADWILMMISKEDYIGTLLWFAVFRGAKEPHLDYATVSTSRALCGTFNYTR